MTESLSYIAIFGVPRSGTSWLGQIFNSSPHVAYRYQPIFAYSFDDTLTEDSSQRDIQTFHDNLFCTNDDFVCQKISVSGIKTPKFNKEQFTHLVWKEVRYLNVIENLMRQTSIKIVGLVRHPCGVLTSWMNAPKEFEETWNIYDQWRFAEKKNNGKHEFYGFEQWIIASQLFLNLQKKYPRRFRIVKYESLLNDPETQTVRLFDFAGLNISSQTNNFLQKSTRTASDDPYDVFRKNKVADSWKTELPEEIIESILLDDRFLSINKSLKI